MKPPRIVNALEGLDPGLIAGAAVLPRRRCPPPAWIRWAAAAACLCLCLAGAFLIRKPDTGPAGTLTAPQYVPRFSSPELEQLREAEPYARLLPRKIPETLVFVSGYQAEYDPAANPDRRAYLSLVFGAEETATALEIQVEEYDGVTPAADPGKPETYDLAPYYDGLPSHAPGAAACPEAGLFRAGDLTAAIAEKRCYVFADGRCKAEIQVLCGEYVVSYHYYGVPLSPRLFYDTITSSPFFQP